MNNIEGFHLPLGEEMNIYMKSNGFHPLNWCKPAWSIPKQELRIYQGHCQADKPSVEKPLNVIMPACPAKNSWRSS